MVDCSQPLQIFDGVLYGQDEHVAEFVRQRIPRMVETGAQFANYKALGVVVDNKLIGGVVYHNYRPLDRNIEMSAAFDSPRYATRTILRRLFTYPFITLRCVRMTTCTGRRNKRARRANRGFGWVLEGVIRKAIGGVEDEFVFGMLAEECPFLEGGPPLPSRKSKGDRPHGQ